MKNDLRYFFIQTAYNVKNAHALTKSFWISVISMMLNNLTFFIIWMLFMNATGPIQGWTGMDVFGMLGVSLLAFGITNGIFYGIVDLPQIVLKGTFDGVLLSPVNSFLKLAGNSFLVTAYGDILQGILVAAFYGIYTHLNFYSWMLYIVGIILGCVIFLCVRMICSMVVFFIHDGEVVSTQLFDIFLRPSLYPGSIFPDKLKIFFMTAIPALLTGAVPIYLIKNSMANLMLFAALITVFWVLATVVVFKFSVKRYESGNFLR